jgi:hypothetical protein
MHDVVVKANATSNMKSSIALFAILVVSFLSLPCVHAGDPEDEITQATMRYVFKEAGVNDPVVAIEKAVDGYARVKVTSESGATDPAIAFLKALPSGKWKVLTLGTGFAPEDLAELGIPASLAK